MTDNSKPYGLRFRFLLAISTLLLITLGPTAFYFSEVHKQQLLTNLEERINSLGNFTALVSPEALYAFDITTLDRYIEQISNESGVKFAVFVDSSNQPLTTNISDQSSFENVNIWLSNKHQQADKSFNLMEFPILADEEKIAKLIVMLDYTEVDNKIKKDLINQLILYVGIILFLGFIIYIIFRNTVLFPVEQLMRGANKLSEGDYTRQLNIINHDELGQLTKCFNKMAIDINNDHQALKSINIRLSNEIEKRSQIEQKLRQIASVFTHAKEGIIICDKNAHVINVNQAFTNVTGYSKEEVIGKSPSLWQSGKHEKEFYEDMWNRLNELDYWNGEIWNKHKNGSLIAELLTISVVRDDNGDIQHYVALFTDISDQKNREKELEHSAHYDPLTNLPNRVLVSDRLHQAMTQATRRNSLLAIAYLDLDGFKQINDTFGHNTGDRLLINISKRMHNIIRESDTVGRLGGDEFVAIFMDLHQESECIPLLDRLIEAASTPILIDGHYLQVSASIGVSFFPQNEEIDGSQLLRQADQAMYQSKILGKNRYTIFKEASLDNQTSSENQIDPIKQAYLNNEFELYYQPKIELGTGKLLGTEALIRWNHPDKGLLLPGAFLPTINNHPLAIEIGEWVINQALLQLEEWNGTYLDLPISVNIDAYHLQQDDFPERLEFFLNKHPTVNPSQIEFELLETNTLSNITRVASIMEKCMNLGVDFALDDFGTGYSSLLYLKHLPAQKIKIDQVFVRDMLEDTEDLSIVEGIIGLAAAFQRSIIAEGMETVEHGQLLRQLGCENVQGFAVAKPMPAIAMHHWYASWKPDPVWKYIKPVKNEYFPMLSFFVSHNKWQKLIENLIDDDTDNTRQIAKDQECHLGRWLLSEAENLLGNLLYDHEILKLHEDCHRMGDKIIKLVDSNNKTEALETLKNLKAAGLKLIVRLNCLLS
jgi:diguanylate cyclase (GGDEF)-like protein/PAS domain S-box-containing protein